MIDAPVHPDPSSGRRYVAFDGARRLCRGPLAEVAAAVRQALERGPAAALLVFDADTGRVVDLDLRGGEADVRARYAEPAPAAAGRGRPKLGVVAREVTLLPRHWDWLGRQPGGASVALRRLVDAARKDGADAQAEAARRDAAYRFMVVLAGDLAGFEDASRALFAGDKARLEALAQAWPPDVAAQTLAYLDGQGALAEARTP